MSDSSPQASPQIDSAAPSSRRRPKLLYVIFVCVLIAAGIAWLPKWITLPEFTPQLAVIADDQSGVMAAVAADAPDYAAAQGVVLEYELTDMETVHERALRDFATGTRRYDAICVLKSVLVPYARTNLVLRPGELREQIDDPQLLAFEQDVYPNVWEACASYWAADGSKRIEPAGYPVAVNALLLMYNRRMFDDPAAQAAYRERYGEALEVPRDWERFRRVAEFFTSGDSKGVCLSSDPVWRYIEWCNVAFGMGGAIYDKQHGWQGEPDTPLLLDAPATVAATEFYLGLKPFNHDHGRAETGVEAVKALVETMGRQRIAMCFVRSDFLHELGHGETRDNPRFGFAPSPGNVTTVDARVLYVSRDTPTPRAIARYAASLMQKETQARLMQEGLCSAVKSVYEDPQVRKIPYARALQQSYEPPRRIVLLECTPEIEIAIEAIAENVARAWSGEATAGEALAAARKRIEAERAEAWSKFEAATSGGGN
ncbi:MAG: hypothetical protein WED34_07935 [Planctomycetales bacterium]